MANHPIPDQGREFIESGMVLITDPRSDYYLAKASKRPPNDRYSRPCGGKGGFDDYVERWHQ